MSTNLVSFNVSRRLGMLALGGAFAVLLGAFTGCGSSSGGSSGPINVPLEFRPGHSQPISGTMVSSDVKVHLDAVTDKRDNKEQIGAITKTKSGEAVPVLAADKPATEFVRGVLETELKSFGVDLIDAAEASDRIISIELTRFWVEVGGRFHADVKFVAHVRDKGGRELWKGQFGGDGNTSGRSGNVGNYNLVLSDATRRAVAALISTPQFQQALTR